MIKNKKTQGILTGFDERHEWMLKWWWTHYSKHNNYPVAFCDFGMTKSARMWCASKGTLLTLNLPENFITSEKEVDTKLRALWKPLYKGATWNARQAWFHKPFALRQTPFDETIWIDLDAQVKKPLLPLFEAVKKSDVGFALCKDTPRGYFLRLHLGLLLPRESTYQAGVISYTKDSPVMHQWLQDSQAFNSLFFSDQDILNRAIHKKQFNIYELSTYYNYIPGYPEFSYPDPLIVHYATNAGKDQIFKKIEMHQ